MRIDSALDRTAAATYGVACAGDLARKYMSDPELLRFIDLECFIWSTVDANFTPFINAGMVGPWRLWKHGG